MDPYRGRPPATPNDLLNLAIQAQTSSSAEAELNGPGHHGTIQSQNDRKWLEEAMANSLGRGHDPVKNIISLIGVLKERTAETISSVSSLEELLELTERTDYANDFEKCGGFPVLDSLLSSSSSEVRAKSAELFAQLMQNNPYCQAKALEQENMLVTLLDMMECDEDSHVRAQALLAVSALVRSSQEAQSKFIALDGLSILVRSITRANSEKFQSRAAFMLSCICTLNSDLAEKLGNMGTAQIFITLLQGEHKQHHENLMVALAAILRNSEAARTDAVREEVNLEEFLKERTKNTDKDDQFKEEHEAAEMILHILDGDYHRDEDED